MQTHAQPLAAAYADRTATKAPAWHGLVAADVLLNNLATGLFLVAAIGELTDPVRFTAVASWAHPLALTLLVADLACLVLDLGDPLRFHHMLRVFKPSSPMSLGTWCLTAFSLFLAMIVAVEAAVLVGWLSGEADLAWWFRKFAVAGGLPFAFGSAAYKGVLFSTTAQPGWQDARWLGAYLTSSAVMLGTGSLLAIAATMDAVQAIEILRPALGLFVVLNLIVLALLVVDLYPLLSRLRSRGELRIAGLLLFLFGLVIPVGLLATGGAVPTYLAIAALVLISLDVRFTLVRLPHLVPSAGHAATTPRAAV